MRTIVIETTRSGQPAMWESGGGLTTRGSATIVARPDGSKPRPVFIRRKGDLACQNHALVAIHPGYLVIRASKGSGGWTAAVDRIETIAVDTGQQATATVERLNVCVDGEWDHPLDGAIPQLSKAVNAAVSKAYTYHCRNPMWVETRTPAELAALAELDARSREAKAAGLGARLEALIPRLDALRERYPQLPQPVLGDVYFRWNGPAPFEYTEKNVAEQEQYVAQWERQAAIDERKDAARRQEG